MVQSLTRTRSAMHDEMMKDGATLVPDGGRRITRVRAGLRVLLLAGVWDLAAPRAAGAQERAEDVVMQANRAGEWVRARDVARAALADSATAQSDAGCRLLLSLGYAQARLGEVADARSTLALVDARCGDFLARSEDWRREANALRRDPEPGAAHGTPRTGEDVGAAVPGPAVEEDGFWVAADPARMGLDVPALDAHRLLCERTGADACLVVYRGRIVQEWYAPAYREPALAMSTTKSIAGLLAGMLVDDGRIRSLDERVCAYVAAWCRGNNGAVTIRHLLSMTSGLPMLSDSSVGLVADKNAWVEKLTVPATPGTSWAYSNEGVQMLSPVLDRVAGRPIQEYARERLFAPLGMRSTRLKLDEAGHAWLYADMETTPRDLARVGVLMLHGGAWRGRQIVSREWVARSACPSQPFHRGYGLLWWLHDQPAGFAGHGHLDTHLHVFPALQLVVVRMQARPSDVPEGTYDQDALPIFDRIVPPSGRVAVANHCEPGDG